MSVLTNKGLPFIERREKYKRKKKGLCVYVCKWRIFHLFFPVSGLIKIQREKIHSHKHHSITQCEVRFALCESIYYYCFVFQSDRDWTWALYTQQGVYHWTIILALMYSFLTWLVNINKIIVHFFSHSCIDENSYASYIILTFMYAKWHSY